MGSDQAPPSLASFHRSMLLSSAWRSISLGFVTGQREGRRVVYDLYDDHVAHLLDEAISHVEHVQLGLSGRAVAAR